MLVYIGICYILYIYCIHGIYCHVQETSLR